MNVLEEARLAGKHIFICGNGGSAATASHCTGDFIPVSKMICQQITAIVKVEANHLANKYAREYNKGVNIGLMATAPMVHLLLKR